MRDLRILLDANLSPDLVWPLSELFGEATHVDDVLPLGSADVDIYRYAADHAFTTVITCDQDFDVLARRLRNPAVVRIRPGTLRTSTVERLLRRHVADVLRLHERSRDEPDAPPPLLILP